MHKPTTAETLRQSNRRSVFQYIYDHNGQNITKQDMALALRLSMPTVSGNLADFLKDGLVAYTGTLSSTGGRKPRVISLVTDARFAVGISLMDDFIRIVAIDLKANQLAFQKITRNFINTPAYYKTLANDLEHFLEEHHLDREKLLGVGMTIPGIVDQAQNMITVAPTLGIQNVPFDEIKKHFTSYPFFIQNDANAGGYAEVWARKRKSNFVYLSLERGIGGTILLPNNGYETYTGESGRSGEFGHMCIVPNGRMCRCGRRGCLEAYCSTLRLSDDLGITLDEFFAKLQAGDKDIARMWQEYTAHLAEGLAIIRTIMDCEIVLGGILSNYLEDELQSIRQAVASRCPFDADGSFVLLDSFKSHSTCAGAALHFIRQFLDNI